MARILVTYVTAGAGHRRAAEAIVEALKQQQPALEVECLDVLSCTPAWFQHGYSWSYLFLVRHMSWVWKVSYRLFDIGAIYRFVRPLRRSWNLALAGRFTQRLRESAPDVIVATHFLPTDLCSAGKRAGWLQAALVVIVTDLHPHWFWISRQAEATVVATPESAVVGVRRGIPRDRLHVIGIPVGRAHGEATDRATLQQRLALQHSRTTVLVTSGGTTVGHFAAVVEALLSFERVLPSRLQLLVVCGTDEAMQRRLERIANDSVMPLRVFGFVETMAELMGASDLVVAKAGGLTVSEALAHGLPLILYHAIPGQEQMNALYVERHGAGVIASSASRVAEAVRRCLEEPLVLRQMQQAAKALGHPQAAEQIVSTVIQPLL